MVTNLDAPLRVDVAMPRDLFDRLTDHDEAPRCRYDMGIRRAEFAAAPTLSHESLAAAVSELFIRVAISLEEAGSSIELKVLRSGRLLSDDGAFEADEGLFVGASKIEAAERIDGWLDVRKGHPVPDLVVEIDRSTNSSGKLAPYTSAWACAKPGLGVGVAERRSGSRRAMRRKGFGERPPAWSCPV